MNVTKCKTAIDATALCLILAFAVFGQTKNLSASAIEKIERGDRIYEQAKTLYRQGDAESLKAALLRFEEAQNLYREIGNKRKEETLCLAGRAYVSSLLGEKQRAIVLFNQALSLSKLIKDKIIEAETLGNIGRIYLNLGENKKALINFEQALLLEKSLKDKRGQAVMLNSIGSTYLNLEQHQTALLYFKQALPLRKGDERGKANTLQNIGTAYFNSGDKQKALDYFELALDIRTKVEDKRGVAETLSSLGWFYANSSDKQKSLDYFNQALALAKDIGDKTREAEASYGLQTVWVSMGNLRLAIFYGKQSVNVYQQLRGAIKELDKETQKSYLKTIDLAYRKLAEILISEGRLPEAQTILDLIKSEEFKDLARGDGKADTVPYNKSEAEAVAKIDKLAALGREQATLQKLKKQLGDAFPIDTQQRLERLAADIKIANAEFENALTALSKTDAGVEARTLEIQGEKNLQSALQNLGRELNTGAVALYTVIGTEEEKDANGKPLKDKTRSKFGWVILVTSKDRKAYPIDVTNLEQTVFQFRAALSSDKYDPKPLAAKIYNAIFRQTSAKQTVTLEQDLREILGKYQDKTIMWSLDGVLRYIPMAALHDGDSYLVEKYRSVVFTKESLLWLMNQPTAKPTTLGLGVSSGNKDLSMSALPGVDKELADIIKQTDEKTGILNGTRKKNGDFKKQEILNLKDDDNNFQVVHIASHYSFNPTDQNASYLLVGDGKLTFGDMKTESNLFGTVDLLTLSACDTGVSGNGKEAEGFAYLAQSLGAKSVIASLWKVSDAGTPELMIRFYKLRAEHPEMSKGEAFRRAQISLLLGVETGADAGSDAARSKIIKSNASEINLPLFVKDEKKPFAHPHFWSSFVLIGNWR